MAALTRRLPSAAIVLMFGLHISVPISFPAVALSTIEGKITFVGKAADKTILEVSAGGSRVIAEVPTVPPTLSSLLNYHVRLSGELLPTRAADGYPAADRLFVRNTNAIEILASARKAQKTPTNNPPILRTTEEVHSLRPEQADAKYPVRIRGVITSRDPNGGMVQDATRGVYVFGLKRGDDEVDLQVADYVEVEGVTERGTFAPMIISRSTKRLGHGSLPLPMHPTWERLNNGSLDCQYVEIEGFVTEAHDSTLVLLMPEGHFGIALVPDPNAPRPPGALHAFAHKHVSIRGTVFATRDNKTHRVRAGSIGMGNAVIGLGDPVLTLDKRIGELLQFDARASAFHLIRVSGQVLHARGRDYYLSDGSNGLRFVTKHPVSIVAGDRVEVTGFPRVAGSSPVLVEAAATKLCTEPLPSGQRLAPAALHLAHIGSLVEVESRLLGVRTNRSEIILDLQGSSRSLVARLQRTQGDIAPVPIGSLLRLSGVYAGHGKDRITGVEADSFELLLNSPASIEILERPSWWTPKRALIVVGSLIGALFLGAGWVVSLRRKVEARTGELKEEIEERKRIERERLLEAERSRLARDLHDELGSRITEISLLANVGAGAPPSLEKAHERFHLIADKAGGVVDALDVIVWAVNPATDALQPLADYVSSFAREFLSSCGIRCRLKVPIQFPVATLDSHARHNLFMAVKESLNNAARHSSAPEVEFTMAVIDDDLQIAITDNGIGFDASNQTTGMGLANIQRRLDAIGGRCFIQSQRGGGSTVTLRLPLRNEHRIGAPEVSI